jgi:hypothetical protein
MQINDLLRYAEILELAANEFLTAGPNMPWPEVGSVYTCGAVRMAAKRYHQDHPVNGLSAGQDYWNILQVFTELGMNRHSLGEFDYVGKIHPEAIFEWPGWPDGVKFVGPGKYNLVRPTPEEKQEWRYAWLMFVALLAREQAEFQ